MKRVVVATSPFIEPHEFLGVDLELYTIRPNAVLILPELNAKVLEKHRLVTIIGEYREPEEDPFEKWQRESIDPLEFLEDSGESKDPVKAWAEAELQKEYSKPSPDPNRIVELRMIAKGLNPAAILSNDTTRPAKPARPSPATPTQSHQGCPTGLCSPFSITVQAQNFEDFIEEDEFKYEGQKLRRALETFGLRCITTLQAARISGLNQIDLSGYAILDYGYTRVELHEEFARLLHDLGYDIEKDFALTLLFEEYRCEKHGYVYKPVIDWEKKFFNEDGDKKKSFKLIAGRLHPLKKYSDSKRYSALKLEQIRAINDVASQEAVSYRVFDGFLKKVRQRDLALLWMVFTIPDKLSRDFASYTLAHPGKVEDLMRKAVRSTLKRFLRKYLKKHENVPLYGDFKMGGLMNVHIWSSSEPTKPHFHVHVMLWNIVIHEGEIIRFSPYFPKEWLKELRKLWASELRKRVKKSDVYVWTDPFRWEEDFDSFNIYTSYTWLDKDESGELKGAGRIAHHLRYNSRKAVVDLNVFFYSGVKADELTDKEKEWVKFLLEYSNRTSNFGFMNNWRKVFGIRRDVVEEFLERLQREHYEYCPICKAKLEYVRLTTIDEVVRRRRLLVLWYFDRRMNIEVWRGL